MIRRDKNQSGMVLASMGAGMGLIVVFAHVFMNSMRNETNHIAQDWTRFVALQTARSGFIVLESALRRRMWELPPDSNCHRLSEFSVDGEAPGGADFTVEARYVPSTQMLVLSSSGHYRGSKIALTKFSKILDASQFLVFSKSQEEAQLQGAHGVDNADFANGLIAGSRKVYFEGPVVFKGSVFRMPWQQPHNQADWNSGGEFRAHDHVSQIIQGERIYMLGGMRSGESFGIFAPTAGLGDLAWQESIVDYPNRMFNDAPNVYIGADLSETMNLVAAIENNDLSTVPAGTNDKIYPHALFGKGQSLPVGAEGAVDDGNFHDTPDDWLVLEYLFGSGWTHQIDATCYQDNNLSPAARKHCNDSNHFPNGFNSWRATAGLDGVLVGGEGAKLDFPTMSWDNLKALEDEAVACGLVVDANDSSSFDGEHEDCDISDLTTLEEHLANPAANRCQLNYVLSAGERPKKVLDLDISNLGAKLNNFDASSYSTLSPAQYMRRVVYIKNRTQISQTSPSGLWPALADPAIRNNLPIWFVMEDELIIKPHQPDLTSPLDERPAERRVGYFNEDQAGTFSPLSLVMVSPEPVTVISPTHQPLSFAQMQQQFPVVGGRIVPRRSIYTDFVTQEEDGFKFGVRRFRFKNIALITNAATTKYATGFWFRGLFALDAYGSHMINRACWFDKPGDGIARSAVTDGGVDELSVPAYHADPEGWIPPITSRFYDRSSGTEQVPFGHSPNVFRVQEAQGLERSQIRFEGLRMLAEFDSSVPAGKRDLNEPLYKRFDFLNDPAQADAIFNPGDRAFIWDKTPTWWYENTPPLGSACATGSIFWGGGYQSGYNIWFYTNRSQSINASTEFYPLVDFQQNSPSFDYDNLGSLATSSLPVTQIGE